MSIEDLIKIHFGDFDTKELKIIQNYFYTEKLPKNHYFTRTNQICDKLSFITSGIVRMYALLEDGREVTQWLATQNYMITDVMGFFFGQKNRWEIKAFTDTELLTITQENYLKLCTEIPQWSSIEKKMIMECFATMENRIFAHLSLTAEERYLQYFQANQQLFNQVPLQYIASLLGMTPETFSRIRKKSISNS